MIRHIVCWKLKEEAMGRTKQENARLIRDELNLMKTRIPVIRRMDIGIDPGLAPGNWDLVLDSDFNSFADLQIYQDHPEHTAFKKFIHELRDLRACVDFEW